MISDFATLPPLPCLVNLDASKTPLLSLKNLEKQPKLKNVNLRDCVQLTDLSAMAKMRSLSSVLMLPDFDQLCQLLLYCPDSASVLTRKETDSALQSAKLWKKLQCIVRLNQEALVGDGHKLDFDSASLNKALQTVSEIKDLSDLNEQ